MTNQPPGFPPWGTSPPPGGAPSPPSQGSAFSNPVVGTVSSGPGGLPEGLRQLFPYSAATRRPLRDAPIPVLAASMAIVAQVTFSMVVVVAITAAAGAAKGLSQLESEFGTGTSGASEGEVVLVFMAISLWVMLLAFLMVAFKLLSGSWKAWFGAMAIQAFFLLVGLYMVIQVSGTWVLGLFGPVGIAALLALPQVREWVSTETTPGPV